MLNILFNTSAEEVIQAMFANPINLCCKSFRIL